MAAARDTLFSNYDIASDKPIPFHAQVYEAIEAIIRNGDLQPGDQLPGEPRLCDLFGVSRTVIRQALEQLMRDGLVVRIMGKGTFVAQPRIDADLVGRLTGFHEDMLEHGHVLVSNVLKQESGPASPKVARYLQIPVGEEIIEMQRLRYIGHDAISLGTIYLPYKLCAPVMKADFRFQSLYRFLREACGLKFVRSERWIEAVLATEEEAKFLGVESGAPLILLESVTYLEDGTAMEYYHSVNRSDRARFKFNVVHK